MTTLADRPDVGVLPLENGDHLTRAEFERRYEAMPRLKKAELVEGVVYFAPSVAPDHGEPHADLVGWLGLYASAYPGVILGDNTSVRLDADNEVQPDAYLRREGGSSRRVEGFIEGPPEFVAEVAASSASYDLHTKMNVYRRTGVQEYLVWRVLERRIDWFTLDEGRYAPLEADGGGVIHSRVFPGLRLAVDAMLARDMATVLAEQQRAP